MSSSPRPDSIEGEVAAWSRQPERTTCPEPDGRPAPRQPRDHRRRFRQNESRPMPRVAHAARCAAPRRNGPSPASENCGAADRSRGNRLQTPEFARKLSEADGHDDGLCRRRGRSRSWRSAGELPLTGSRPARRRSSLGRTAPFDAKRYPCRPDCFRREPAAPSLRRDLLCDSQGHVGQRGPLPCLRGQRGRVSARARRFCSAERSGHDSAGSKRCVSINPPVCSPPSRLLVSDRSEFGSLGRC